MKRFLIPGILCLVGGIATLTVGVGLGSIIDAFRGVYLLLIGFAVALVGILFLALAIAKKESQRKEPRQ